MYFRISCQSVRILTLPKVVKMCWLYYFLVIGQKVPAPLPCPGGKGAKGARRFGYPFSDLFGPFSRVFSPCVLTYFDLLFSSSCLISRSFSRPFKERKESFQSPSWTTREHENHFRSCDTLLKFVWASIIVFHCLLNPWKKLFRKT